METQELRINSSKRNKALAIFAASVALAGCGGNTKETKMSPVAQPKPTPAEVQPTTNTGEVQKDLNPVTSAEIKGIEGGPNGFPLKAEINYKGSGEFELLVINTNKEAASSFAIIISALDKNLRPITPASIDAGSYKVKEVKLKPRNPNEIEASVMTIDVPGLESGDTLTIKADIPGAERVYEQIIPYDQRAELRWSDKVYAKPTD